MCGPKAAELNRFVSSTQATHHIKYDARSLLVLLLLFYVNLFKERFFLRVSGSVFPKADAKVLLFHEPTK